MTGSRLPHRAVRGFTLLELLVALSLMALVGVLAYGGLQSLLDAGETTQRQADRLGRVQLAVALLARDLEQAVERGVRDARGEDLPALAGGRDGMELTSAGHANPTEARRATIQRVRWGVEDGELVRWTWPVLDRSRSTLPSERRLLDGVHGLGLEYRSGARWQPAWPAESQAALPEAVRFTLELGDWGRVVRVVILPGDGP